MHLNYRDAKPTHERHDEGSGEKSLMVDMSYEVGQVEEQALFIGFLRSKCSLHEKPAFQTDRWNDVTFIMTHRLHSETRLCLHSQQPS